MMIYHMMITKHMSYAQIVFMMLYREALPWPCTCHLLHWSCFIYARFLILALQLRIWWMHTTTTYPWELNILYATIQRKSLRRRAGSFTKSFQKLFLSHLLRLSHQWQSQMISFPYHQLITNGFQIAFRFFKKIQLLKDYFTFMF